MGTEIGSLYYDLNIDDKRLKSQLDDSEKHFQNFGNKVSNILKIISASIVIDKIKDFGVTTVKAFQESQDIIAQTNAVIKSTGGVAGVTAGEVERLAKSLQNASRFSDEQIQSGENMLLTFTNIGKNVFPKATQAITDMATAMHQDLNSTAIQVGKALQFPVEGVTALQRVGVRLSEQQKKQVEDFMAVGDVASAQGVILKELQTEFGGSAAAADKAGGVLDDLKDRFTNLQESIGGLIFNGLQRLAVWLSDLWQNHLKNVVTQIADYLQPKFEALAYTIENDVVPVLSRLWHEVIEPLLPVLGTALVLAIGGAVDVLNALLQIVTPLINFFLDNKDFLLPIIGAFVALKAAMIFDSAFNAITIGFNTLKLVTIPSTIASLQTLQAALTGFAGWGIFLGVALAAFSKIMASIDQLKLEIDAANSSLVSLGNAQDDFYRSLKKAKDEGRITQDEFLRRSQAYTQSVQMPGRAIGGSVMANHPYIVGEKGKELFVPSQNGEIIPNNKLGNTGGDTYININTVNDRSDADYIIRRLDRGQERVAMGMSG